MSAWPLSTQWSNAEFPSRPNASTWAPPSTRRILAASSWLNNTAACRAGIPVLPAPLARAPCWSKSRRTSVLPGPPPSASKSARRCPRPPHLPAPPALEFPLLVSSSVTTIQSLLLAMLSPIQSTSRSGDTARRANTVLRHPCAFCLHRGSPNGNWAHGQAGKKRSPSKHPPSSRPLLTSSSFHGKVEA